MSGKNSRLNPLALHKQLLIAESELNRAQLVQEWQTMAGEVHALAHQARTIACIASAAASLVAGLSALRHKQSKPAAEKPSWWRILFKGAGMVGTFWSEFHTRKNPDSRLL